jgi:cytochrome c-type biogenesis protein CcsB
MTSVFELNSGYFANISFVFLFLAMTFYWINLAFFDKQKSKFLKASPLSTGLSNTLEVNTLSVNQTDFWFAQAPFGFRKAEANRTYLLVNLISNLPKLTLVLSNLSLILLLCTRWKESGHFPLSNLYESLMFLSWSCTSINIFLFFFAPSFGRSRQNLKNDLFMEKLLGSVLAPCALFLNAFATFSLPKEMQQAGPLVPALQSNWLMMHVTVMIVSYAALILGSLLSIAFLIYNVGFLKNSTSVNPWLNTKALNLTHSKILYYLDYYSYRIIGIGFPFLTIGILSGAVWANEAWGSYWSWDPKETWALLTWLIFAIYLHTRLTKGWEGTKPAMIASFGFIVVWVCYLGVNLLGEGLHSYGFLT